MTAPHSCWSGPADRSPHASTSRWFIGEHSQAGRPYAPDSDLVKVNLKKGSTGFWWSRARIGVSDVQRPGFRPSSITVAPRTEPKLAGEATSLCPLP